MTYGHKNLSMISFSNVPFTDPTWKDNLHYMVVSELENESHPDLQGFSYSIHKKLMLDLAYILTIRGHEIYICHSQNPSEKNGEYIDFSKLIREKVKQLKSDLE